jgi:hypothetical protein
MSETIVQDVLGEPESWANCVSDQLIGLPNMRGATILDVFVSRKELTLYALGTNGAEAMAVFVIEDQDLRQKIASAMHPGVAVLAALRASI